MNDIQYREQLEEARDAMDDALVLLDQAIAERGRSVEAGITKASTTLNDAVTLVEKTIEKYE